MRVVEPLYRPALHQAVQLLCSRNGFSGNFLPEQPQSSGSLSQTSVWIVHCAPRFPMGLGPGEPAWLWPGEVFSEFRDDECVRGQIFTCHPCLHTWLCGSTVVVQACLLLLETKTSTPKKSFLATCGTCYQSNTCRFFVRFCCGFNDAVAILLWSGLSAPGLSHELQVCVSYGSRFHKHWSFLVLTVISFLLL